MTEHGDDTMSRTIGCQRALNGTITALILLVPSVLFMLFIERFLRADVLAKVEA